MDLHSVDLYNLLVENGELFTFGSNQFGQLGHGSAFSGASPHKVEGLANSFVSFVSCGDTFTVAATDSKHFPLTDISLCSFRHKI